MTQERTGIIYIATINGEKSYIGFTVDYVRRIKEHLRAGEDTLFHRAIRKHGVQSIQWRVLEGDIPESRLPDREVLWIAFYDTYNNGYNMTEGGDAPPRTTADSAAKRVSTMREQAARGEHWSQRPEARAANSARQKAMVARGEHPLQRPDVRAKLSAGQKARVARGEHNMQRPEVRAKIAATHKAKSARGEHWSQRPEARAANSARQKAMAARGEHPLQRPDVRAKLSAAKKGKKLTPESIKNREITKSIKKVARQSDTGQTFWCDMTLRNGED